MTSVPFCLFGREKQIKLIIEHRLYYINYCKSMKKILQYIN